MKISDSATTPPILIALPPEILIQIICSLPLSDVFSFQLANKYLYSIIHSSVDVQYHIGLTSSCTEDNPYSFLPISEKLQALKEREKAWSLVKPRFTTATGVPNHAWRYQLLAGMIFLGDFERNTVHFLRLPRMESDERQWEKITTDNSVIEFCPVVEYDLIIIVTTTPQTQVDNPTVHRIEIELRQISTGQAHPQARESRIFVMTSQSEKPTVYVRIVGDNLVPIFSFDGNQEDDQIFVFQWRSGELKANWRAEHGSSATCLFLSEDILLIPNRHTNSLNIFQIPVRRSLVSPTPFLVLNLPKLSVRHVMRYIFPRTKPDPFTSPSQWASRNDGGLKRSLSNSGFFAREKETISIFQVVIDDMFGRRNILAFIIQTRTLMELVDTHYGNGQHLGASEPVVLPYSVWGPSATRWFSTIDYANTWVASSWGQRYVQVKYHTSYDGVPLIVMDFNPERVKEWQRVNGKRKEEATTGNGNEGGPKTWCVSSLDQVEPSGIFEEPVWGSLPYVASMSEALYPFHGVMMDDERVLGVTENDAGDIESVEVLCFG